jgi:hypothetical protein
MFKLAALVNGTIPEAGVQWVTGLIIVIGIGIVLIVFVKEIRGLRSQAANDMSEKLKEERHKIQKDVELDHTLRGMTSSFDRLYCVVEELKSELRNKTQSIEDKVDAYRIMVAKVEQSVRAAHRRIDEHRAIDHGLANKNGYSDYLTERKEIEDGDQTK